MNKQVEKIRAEIERLKKDNNGSPLAVCNDLLSFIDSMPEEPVNEELEKVAYEYSLYPVAPSKFVLAEQGFKDGANWQKQQLMKKAIEGIVTTNIDGWINVMTGFIRPEEAGANFGNKVKLIIIKEDGR